MNINLTRKDRNGSIFIDLLDDKQRVDETYIAKSVDAALVVTESLLNGDEPPRHYNKQTKAR